MGEETDAEPKYENEEVSGSAAESDDASVRRSKRTPIPKRSFKLIDDYASKGPAKKKFREETDAEPKYENEYADPVEEVKIKTELEDEETCGNSLPEDNTVIENKENSLNKTPERSEEEANDHDEPDESTVPRKSGRSRKPKTFEDSVIPIK